jgi:[acyl-carrier-protein] S-malonyltransferase
MAAVLKMKPETVQEIVDRAAGETGEELRIANYNTPAQLVVSGTVQAVQRACDLVKENKGRAVSLPVSGAFHSNLMQEAADELAGFMARLNWSDARIPIHLNVTATPESGSEAILDSLKKQMVSPVLWSQTIQDQWDRGVTQWYELGPKGVLTRMMRHILQAQEGWQADTVESLEKARSMAGSSTNAPGE